MPSEERKKEGKERGKEVREGEPKIGGRKEEGTEVWRSRRSLIRLNIQSSKCPHLKKSELRRWWTIVPWEASSAWLEVWKEVLFVFKISLFFEYLSLFVYLFVIKLPFFSRKRLIEKCKKLPEIDLITESNVAPVPLICMSWDFFLKIEEAHDVILMKIYLLCSFQIFPNWWSTIKFEYDRGLQIR